MPSTMSLPDPQAIAPVNYKWQRGAFCSKQPCWHALSLVSVSWPAKSHYRQVAYEYGFRLSHAAVAIIRLGAIRGADQSGLRDGDATLPSIKPRDLLYSGRQAADANLGCQSAPFAG